MKHDEILQAAKEVGYDWVFPSMPLEKLERFAAIIEKRTIERCASVCETLRDLQIYADKQEAQNDCAAAIRAMERMKWSLKK